MIRKLYYKLKYAYLFVKFTLRGWLTFKTHVESGLVLVKGLTSINVFCVDSKKAVSVKVSYVMWYQKSDEFISQLKQRLNAQDN